MKEYALLFPLIFIIHDLEEIIGLRIWLKKNQCIFKNYPKVLETYKNFSTEGFAVAVLEELLLCSLLSTILYFTNNLIISYLWLGGFVGCTLHFVIHVITAIMLKQYIPSLITSLISLPVCIVIIRECIVDVNITMILLVIVGILIVAVNLRFAQKLIGWFTIKMDIS